jgi:hypothetical protein
LIIPVLLFFRLQQGGKRLTMKLVNGFARRMHVYLIGKDSSAIDTIRDSLNDHGLKTIRQSMPELSKKARRRASRYFRSIAGQAQGRKGYSSFLP